MTASHLLNYWGEGAHLRQREHGGVTLADPAGGNPGVHPTLES